MLFVNTANAINLQIQGLPKQKSSSDPPPDWKILIQNTTINGSPAWNTINFDEQIIIGDDEASLANYTSLCFIFTVPKVTKTGRSLIRLMAAYGPNQWSTKPSSMAKTGYPFTWDINQNIILPANLKLTEGQTVITLEDYIKNIINT